MDFTKLRHFVTIASPIDKINYFFESFRSKYHRYTRVVETLRGDIGTPPFSQNDKPNVHWVNYYDEGDLIAGGLHSPVSRKNMGHRVDNVHVSNIYFPDPGKSHSAYFENRRVISEVFEMIYEGGFSYEKLSLLPNNGGYDYESAARAPGDKRGGALKFQVMAAIVPWSALFACILYPFSFFGAATVFIWIAVGLLFALFGSWLLNKGKGNRMPL